MSAQISEQTVGQLVAEKPGRSIVFERFHIDYCCGGKRTLADACRAGEIDLSEILRDLHASDTQNLGEERDWTNATLTELANHIEATHHAYLRGALPRLDILFEKVVRAHGASDPRLAEAHEGYSAFRAEMEAHTTKEELILFPLCRELDHAEKRPRFHCGSVANPIRVMVAEHEDAGEALQRLSELTDGFVAPKSACNTYRALLAGLQELEIDTHRHVHKENSILFPNAQAAENHLATGSALS